MIKTLEYYMSLHYPVKLIEREDGSYFATHPDLQGCMAEGATADEAVRNLRDSRELWIDASLMGGLGIPEPAAEDEYSGKLLLRMSPRLHAGLSEAAANENISLNQFINGALSEYLGGARLYAKLLESLRRTQEAMLSRLMFAEMQSPALRNFPAIEPVDTGVRPSIPQQLLGSPRDMLSRAQFVGVDQ